MLLRNSENIWIIEDLIYCPFIAEMNRKEIYSPTQI